MSKFSDYLNVALDLLEDANYNRHVTRQQWVQRSIGGATAATLLKHV